MHAPQQPQPPIPKVIPSLPDWQDTEWTEIQVEIIPGHRRTVKVPKHRPPKFIVYRLMKNPRSGEFFTVPTQPYGPCVRLADGLPAQLGLPIGMSTLKRLIYAGFIRAYKLAPQTILLDLDSLWEHLDRTRIDPDHPSFWTHNKRLRYSEWRTVGDITEDEENGP